MKNATTEPAVIETPATVTPETAAPAAVKVRKTRSDKVERPAKVVLPPYKNTLKMREAKGKTPAAIKGEGTIKDLAELLGWDVPPAHGLTKGLALLGMATVVADKTAPKPLKGRTSKVYAFNAELTPKAAPAPKAGKKPAKA